MPPRLDIHLAEERLQPANRLQRYARGRINHFWMRQGLTAIGSMALALLVSPIVGLISVLIALLGEILDCSVLRYLLKNVDLKSEYRKASILTIMSGSVQAFTISVCVLLAWLGAEDGTAVHFSMSFLAAAAMNAGIVWPFHPPTAKAKLTIFGLCGFTGFIVDFPFSEQVTNVQIFNTLGHLLLVYLVGFILRHIIKHHNRDRKNVRTLLASTKSLEATHEKLVESQIKAHRLSLVAKHANDSVIITDASTNITWVNEAFEKITGYTAKEAIGRKPSDLFNGPKTDMKTVKKIGQSLAAGNPFRTEILNYRKNKEEIWVETNLVPVTNQAGETTMVVAIERDITRLKKHEAEMTEARAAAERGERAKSEFLATMSHEIRTPMNGIIGLSDLLRECELPEEAASYAATIQSSAEALLTIINDVLDFSKLDAGKVSIDPREFDLRACLADTVSLFEGQAATKGIYVDMIQDSALPDLVVGDQGRIRQILVNLIGNAMKFTQVGGVTLKSHVTASDHQFHLKIEISDTGIGIAPEQIGAIFDKFSQADSQITRKFGGTGLGLAISRLLARRMGGDISAKSQLDVGSTFIVTLVLEKPVADQSPISATEKSGAAIGSLSILVAEDNETNRFLIGKYLKDLPIDLRFAKDGREAVDETNAASPDVIFMDMSMPRMDGLEATRLIRTRQGHQPHIIALTANAFASDKAACLDAGMDDFLTKPVRKADLIGKLAQITQTQNLPQTLD